MCVAIASVWEASTPFQRCVWRFPAPKTIISLCHCKCRRIFFFFGQCLLKLSGQFVVCEAFFFFFVSFLFSSSKMTAWSSLLLIFQIQSIFFWFLIFVLGLFVNIYLFWISSFNLNLSYIMFSNLVIILLIFNFFLVLFVKVLFVFNFFNSN
jgi:hypothetical protein